ncbi:unnamed protein product [Amoebophrya sp. A25]|nr:unnamed protein product [Amoebophrya sp. A25]|eukprot:GSA25T00016344001.1
MSSPSSTTAGPCGAATALVPPESNIMQQDHAGTRPAVGIIGDGLGGRQPELPTRPVGIVGGGLGGLALAVKLEEAKIPYLVFERDAHVGERKQGYGMTLTPSGLRGLGIEGQCRARSQASDRHWVFDGRDGQILGYFGRGLVHLEDEQKEQADGGVDEDKDNGNHGCNKADYNVEEDAKDERESTAESKSSSPATSSSSSSSGENNFRIPRQELRQMLLQKLPSEKVMWGMQLLDFEEERDHADESGVIAKFNRTATPMVVKDERGGDDSPTSARTGSTHRSTVSTASPTTSTPSTSSTAPSTPSSASTTQVRGDDRVEIACSLLVGADGIRSQVARLLMDKKWSSSSAERKGDQGATKKSHDNDDYTASSSSLNPLNVSVVIGLSRLKHPLIRRGGFYAFGDGKRLFVMPFSDELTMWQLSFSDKGGKMLERVKGEAGADSDTSGNNVQEKKDVAERIATANERIVENCPQRNQKSERACATPTTNTSSLPKRLQKFVLDDLLKDWFPACRELVEQTEILETWATHLYDRDPTQVLPSYMDSSASTQASRCTSSTSPQASTCTSSKHQHDNPKQSVAKSKDPSSSRGSRPRPLVTLLGDAAHAMSMFKGQGANQALLDGQLLAKLLIKASSTRTSSSSTKALRNCLSRFEREMCQRAGAKVFQSREACRNLHVEDVGDVFPAAGGKVRKHGAELQAARPDTSVDPRSLSVCCGRYSDGLFERDYRLSSSASVPAFVHYLHTTAQVTAKSIVVPKAHEAEDSAHEAEGKDEGEVQLLETAVLKAHREWKRMYS